MKDIYEIDEIKIWFSKIQKKILPNFRAVLTAGKEIQYYRDIPGKFDSPVSDSMQRCLADLKFLTVVLTKFLKKLTPISDTEP